MKYQQIPITCIYLIRPMTITKEQTCKLKSTIDGQIILPDNC